MLYFTLACLSAFASALWHHRVHASTPSTCSPEDGCVVGDAMLQARKGLTTEIVDTQKISLKQSVDRDEPCPFIESFANGRDSTIQIPQDEDDPLLVLPDDEVSQALFGGAPDLITWLNNYIAGWQESVEDAAEAASMFADVYLGSSNATLGDGVIDGCEELSVVQNEDVVGMGYYSPPNGVMKSKSLCAAINPCKHTYAFYQNNILPSLPLGTFITVELNAVAISKTRGLTLKSQNPMWEGHDVPEYLFMSGHWYVKGKVNIIFGLTENIGLVIEVHAALIFDMDPAGDGSFSPLAKGDKRQPDFGLMLQGMIKPVINLPKDFQIDLGGLIKAEADLLININGETEKKFVFGARLSVNMGEICASGEVLALLCKIFHEDTGLMGAIYMFYNHGAGFGAKFELEGAFRLNNEFLEDLLNFPDGAYFSAGVSLAFIGDSPKICVEWNFQTTCFSSCSANSDCTVEEFCDSVFKTCRKKRDNGKMCGKDSACKSDRCRMSFCRECEEQHHCTDKDPNLYCTDPTNPTQPSQCVAKRANAWRVCTKDYQCASGHCSNLGVCRECLENGHCPSTQYCKSTNSCTDKKDKKAGCTKAYQCKSNNCKWGKCK